MGVNAMNAVIAAEGFNVLLREVFGTDFHSAFSDDFFSEDPFAAHDDVFESGM